MRTNVLTKYICVNHKPNNTFEIIHLVFDNPDSNENTVKKLYSMSKKEVIEALCGDTAYNFDLDEFRRGIGTHISFNQGLASEYEKYLNMLQQLE